MHHEIEADVCKVSHRLGIDREEEKMNWLIIAFVVSMLGIAGTFYYVNEIMLPQIIEMCKEECRLLGLEYWKSEGGGNQYCWCIDEDNRPLYIGDIV